MKLSKKIAHFFFLFVITLILLSLGKSLNPSSVNAQSCTGVFLCCDEVDVYGNCVGAFLGPFPCQGVTSSQCTTTYPTNYCLTNFGTPVVINDCSWSGPNCSCGSCSVGYVCDYGPDPSSSGPATWNCVGGCCNRPSSCPGISACFPDGFSVSNRVGCAEAPPEPTPPPPPTPTEPPPPVPPPGPDVEPIPQPTPFPCDDVAFPEFHTFRPYQASPCNPNAEDLALYCGNDLIISDPRTVIKTFVPRIIPVPRWGGTYSYEGNPIGVACFRDADCAIGSNCVNGQCSPSNCKDNGDGTETCWFNIERTRSIAIDLSGAEFPIMGYTEPSMGNESDPYRVINSVLQDETMDDPFKVNEYVSWYLNGVTNNPAEYGFLNPDEEEDIYKVINFSGVLRKLLAHRNLRDIIGAEDRQAFGVGIDGTIQQGYESRYNDAGIRHDQAIGCRNALGQITNCYPRRALVSPVRLSDFFDNLPPSEEAFATFIDWYDAYRSWRGDLCVRLFGFGICINNPLDPDWIANLFFHIPLSSTENRKGLVEIANYTIQPPISSTFVILSSSITNQEPAELFFPHMQESSELGRILQQTFTPQAGPIDEPALGAIPVAAPFCDLRTVRFNPGDQLFPGEIRADINYNAMLSCTFVEEGSGIPGDPNNGNLCRFFTGADCIPEPPANYDCAENYGRFDCESGFDCARDCNPVPTGYACDIAFANALCAPTDWSCDTVIPIAPPYNCPSGTRCCQGYSRPLDSLPFPLQQECIVPVQIALRTITETPLADDVWARFVAGPAGIFRHIFPKIEEGGVQPIERLWDIPAVTSVVYSGEGVTVAGNPASGRPANQAELYFPHIGGIHEYFLRCIQKTLRPQGFGEGCVSGPEPLVIGGITPGVCTGDAPPHEGPPPSGGGSCQPAVAGWCSQATLRNYFPTNASATDIRNASIVCAGESGGWSNAFNDGCLCGKSCDYSVGLFQMNLLAHCAGASGFDFDCSLKQCAITDEALVASCRDKFFDPVQNIQAAVNLWENAGRRFGRDWAVAIACGIP